ncbi:molecular chaperone TorD family protein [Ideonella sp. 4Y11]|uniref:Molecular chaperone TorD family protein n=1 Tax=Ideonella aquatica TaxID=2824119 RepID=A0A940YCR9_9BURK|nr:molecular chaperone TorD family protein [Ideonella aquatica]MBQ0957813.1 molecular chaperone TorD family protein [Ideonella aquatica]
MSPTDQPIAIAGSPDAEEVARAELYGLLARLWLAPPDEALLREFAVAVTEAPQEGGFLETPWQDLVGALRGVNVAQATEAFDALFGGVGKPEVFVYGSFYQAGFLNETPLVRLREDLARLGLARTTDTTETEDHIAYGFEVMRYLIGGDDAAVCNLEQQRRFFRSHLQPWVAQLCDTVQAHPSAGWLAALAGMTRAFIEVETQAFDMVE